VKKQAITILIFLILNVLGCGADRSKRSESGVEQRSVMSPDGGTRAFVWKPTMGEYLGATVSDVFEIWLKGVRDIQDEQRVLAADKTTGFELRWRGPRYLDVCYVEAQIFGFRNSVNLISVELQKSYNIEVELKKVDALHECKS
jgi:hypothetical protein